MEFSSNWSAENGLRISGIVQESDTLPTGDLVDLLDEDKCISLVRPPLEQCKDCILRFATKAHQNYGIWNESTGNICKPPKKKCLLGLKILSEARVVEICLGVHEEYHKTIHGTLMGDFGDSKIFVCEMSFDKPQDIVFVKLKATCVGDSIWIYGLHAAVTTEILNLGANARGCHFTSDNLSSVFKDKDVHLSKDADKFRQMLEGFNNGKGDYNQGFMGNNPMAFMSMMFGTQLSKPVPKESELDLQNGNKFEHGNEYCGSEKETLPISKLMNVIENHLAKEKDDKFYDCIEKEAINNIQNKGQLKKYYEQGSCENHTNIIVPDNPIESKREPSQSLSNFIDKLQSLPSDDRLITKEMDKFGSLNTLIDMLSKSNLNSRAQMDEPKSDDVQCEKSQNISCKAHCKCPCDAETVLSNMEKIVDSKLVALEERLLKRIDQKLEERSREEALRMKRIEEMFSKIYDKL